MSAGRNLRRRNSQRQALARDPQSREKKAAAYSLFWHYIEPERQQQRGAEALVRASAAWDAKRARKELPARPWFPWRRSA